ncbi:unnamed protein product, partial [Rotaria sp. Silwood1]
EEVYLFVDWANVYKQAIKQVLCGSKPSTIPEINDTFEQRIAKFIEKMYGKFTEKYITSRLKNLFDILDKSDNAQKPDYEQMKIDLLEVDKREQFVETHLRKAKQQTDRFVLHPHDLLQIACRVPSYDKHPPRERCFLFGSYPSDVDTTIDPLWKRSESSQSTNMPKAERDKEATYLSQEKRLIERFNKYYMVEEFQRVATGDDGYEREKGVDIAVAVKIVDTLRICPEEKRHIRIVLVSADSDFEPLIKYLIANNVSIEVWCWRNGIGRKYREFLTQNDILSYLDGFLYQLGHVTGLEHKYSIKFYRDDDRQFPNSSLQTIFNKLSHYKISSTLSEKFSTSEFVLHWSNVAVTISFLTEQKREEFRQWLGSSGDRLAQDMKQLKWETSLFDKKAEKMHKTENDSFDMS